MLVQDEGLDILIDNVDFAGVTTDVNTTKFTATSFDQGQDVSGTAIEVNDEAYNTAAADSMRVSGKLHFIHHSLFQLSQRLPMVVFLNQQPLLRP